MVLVFGASLKDTNISLDGCLAVEENRMAIGIWVTSVLSDKCSGLQESGKVKIPGALSCEVPYGRSPKGFDSSHHWARLLILTVAILFSCSGNASYIQPSSPKPSPLQLRSIPFSKN
jgi:hypothetical protein